MSACVIKWQLHLSLDFWKVEDVYSLQVALESTMKSLSASHFNVQRDVDLRVYEVQLRPCLYAVYETQVHPYMTLKHDWD